MSRLVGAVLGLLLVTAIAACGDDASSSAAAACDLPTGDDPVDLRADDFTTTIDNPWWPMAPGATWTYRETTIDGDVVDITTTVTDDTKDVDGITTRVVRDTAKQDGEVIEDTFDWYAQDDDGNLWYFGEDTSSYEDGKVDHDGSWEHGVDGALAGIMLPADPEPGCTYRQEYRKGEAEDNGRILGVHEIVEVPAGTYRDALSTQDWTPLEVDSEHKVYARGVGPVLGVQLAGGSERDELLSYRPGG
jgi:hypothetical protein